jgi:hypothetical protein
MSPESPVRTSKTRAAWPVWAVAIFFAILYSAAFWIGIGNAVNVPQFYWALYHETLSAVGWVLLGVGVILSPTIFVLCLLLGRGRSLIARALIYATGLCVVSAMLGSLLISDRLVNIFS